MNKNVFGFFIMALVISFNSFSSESSNSGGFDGNNFVSVKTTSGKSSTLIKFLAIGSEVIVGYDNNEPQWGAVISIETKKSKDILEIVVVQESVLSTLEIAPSQIMDVWVNGDKKSIKLSGQTIDVGCKVMLDGNAGIVQTISHKKPIFDEENIYVITTSQGSIEVSGVMCTC